MNETNTPMMYKITTISTERSFTLDRRTFTTSADLCDRNRDLMTFDTIRAAEECALDYAKRNGYKYLKIGDISTPALGETFVEIRTA